MKNLYIIRGLPGSGKSTFAKTLADAINAVHFEEDMYLTERDGTYFWSEERFNRAICVCHNETHKAMRMGRLNIVVSNVFEDAEQLKVYQNFADEFGYRVTYLIAENRRGGVNVHNVPQDALDDIRNRFEVSP